MQNEQSRVEGAKNVEAKAAPQQAPTPSPSPGAAGDLPTVYVAGDATPVVFSQLTAPEDSEHPASKVNHETRISGAQFVRDVLAELGAGAFEVAAVSPTASEGAGACRALLKRFGDCNRIYRYLDAEGDPSSKPQCIPEFPSTVPSHGAALIIHGLPDCEREQRFHLCLTEAARGKVQSYLEAVRRSEFKGKLRVLVNLDNELPAWPESKPRNGAAAGTSSTTLLDDLRENFRGQVGIVTSLGALRRSGALVNDHSSWEQTVEDLAAELHLFKRLHDLRDFEHLFIRIGIDGLVHIRNQANQLSGTLYFAADRDQGSDVKGGKGCVAGKNTLVITSLLRVMLGAGKDEQWQVAIIDALRAIRRTHDAGYDVAELGKDPEAAKVLVENFVATARQAMGADAPSAPPPKRGKAGADGSSAGEPTSGDDFVCVEIPPYVFTEPAPGARTSGTRWRILDETLMRQPPHRINVAMAIVKAGYGRVLNKRWRRPEQKQGDLTGKIWATLGRPEFNEPHDRLPDFRTRQIGDYPPVPDLRRPRPVVTPNINWEVLDEPFCLDVPIARIGDLVAADRDEIESLNSVANLFRNYVARNDPAARPLSVAVFGPPGSGKTFAVQQIQKAIDPAGNVKFMEFNVAQMRSVEDLAVALNRIGSASHGNTPLAFFDEFDCVFQGRPLGWLQYFLAPMQDGSFYAMNHTINIGRAIFVFAGGIHASFAAFDPRDPLPDARQGEQVRLDYEKQVKEFADRKGPDFISRLRGYLDVQGINEEPGREKRLVQRALQLRGLLRKQKLIGEDGQGMAAVRDEVIYAFLTVDRYRHGVRSMSAILEMCTVCDGQISGASLPSRALLNMHVDAEDFLRRVHRGRLRAQDPEYSYWAHTKRGRKA
jgi:hypothetical protein